MPRPSYTQKITFQKDAGTCGMYKVVGLVGLVQPYIGESFNAEQIQDYIDKHPKVVVTVKE